MKIFYKVCGLLFMFCLSIYPSSTPVVTIKDVNEKISKSGINPVIPQKVQMNFQKELFGCKNVNVNMHHIAAVTLQLPFYSEAKKKAPEFVGGHQQETMRNLIAQGLATPLSEITHPNNCVDFVCTNNFTGEQFLKTTFPQSFDSAKILETIKSSTVTSKRKLTDNITEFIAKSKKEDIVMMGLLKKSNESCEVLTTYPISEKKQFQSQHSANNLKK